MRLYVKKNGDSFVVYRESLLGSIISDTMTIIVFIVLFGLDYFMSLKFGASWLLNFLVLFITISYILGMANTKISHHKTKEELIKEIEGL
jgi:hypothetical protein